MDSTIIVVVICIMVVVVICILLIYRSKKQNKSIYSPSASIIPSPKNIQLFANAKKKKEFVIKTEMISSEIISNEAKVEITDKKVLARIDSLIPGLLQSGNAVNNAVQASKSGGEVLYRAIIPSNAKLADSRDMEGALRGFYKGVDGKIEGHVNLVEVQTQNGAAVATNIASAAMGIASAIVGQYYMSKINSELKAINSSILKVYNFQNNEYKSKVISLIANIEEIANFQFEIIENNELRLSKINHLNNLNEKCTELLGQASITLNDYVENKKLDYKTYEEKLKEAQKWYIYQNSLLAVLYKISDLRYTLHMGTVSRDLCSSTLSDYVNMVADTQKRLVDWHEENTERFGIDTVEMKRKRTGFNKFIYLIPGLINEEHKLRAIDKDTSNIILIQKSANNSDYCQDMSDLYSEDVHIISKDNKIYYLPEGNKKL